MKVLLTLSLTCILFACSSIKKSKHVKVLQATETVIYPGVAGSPTTHHIVVKAEMKKTGKLQCDTFWSNGYADRARVFNSSMQDATGKEVKKGETVVFGFYYFVSPDSDDSENMYPHAGSGSEKAEPARTHDGGLLFRYKIDDSQYYYLSVSDIIKGEPVFGE